MKILILGGTIFLGRHLVETAVKNGHEIILFNRGKHNHDLFPELEKIHGDRDGDLHPMRDVALLKRQVPVECNDRYVESDDDDSDDRQQSRTTGHRGVLLPVGPCVENARQQDEPQILDRTGDQGLQARRDRACDHRQEYR